MALPFFLNILLEKKISNKSVIMKINGEKRGEEVTAKSLKFSWVIMLIFGMYRVMESVILVAMRTRLTKL